MRFIHYLLASFAASAMAAPQARSNNPKDSVAVSLSGKMTQAHTIVPITPAEGEALDRARPKALQKRGAIVVVIGIAAVKGVAILTKIAIEIGADTIKNLKDWKRVREEFTKKTALEMWNKNPDYRKYPAVACYNKGYRLQNPAKIAGKVSAKVELGMLNTDYDCMYMEGGNAFWTNSEGGYINLAYRYNAQRCSFDQKSGDLTCR
ncbi:hypothetical protein B9Z65_3976 [Elsinoe australis]|uniref:DUF7888 domain-containing protein n=1 Tax=Elsinoe australis TaxID=40998 RepID=A0A2P7Z1H6_9PEZI|nr:hypothetical protein B9Z65_3976 [Elsinoe australis]